MSDVAGTSKKGIWIGLVIGVLFLGGGYLLWRVNQEDTVAPTDSDASSTSCSCPYDKCKKGTAECSSHESGIDGCVGCAMEGYYCYIEDANCTTSYVITYVAGEGGSVTNAGPNSVVSGGSISSTATPNTGYRFVKWSDEKTTATRTDSNVQADATYTAQFQQVGGYSLEIYVSPFGSGKVLDGNGSDISGKKYNNLTPGSTIWAKAVPNPGYKFLRWQDGKTDNPRSEKINSNTVWTAIFEALPADKVVLTYIAEPGGALIEINELVVIDEGSPSYDSSEGSGTITQTIDKGGNANPVIAFPLEGCNCEFVKWSDGKTTPRRTDTNVQANATYTALFQKLDRYTLEIYVSPVGSGKVLGENGQDITGEKFVLPPISPDGDKMIAGPGNPFWAMAVPNPGYRFVRWEDGKTDPIRLEAVTKDSVWTATFEVLPADKVVLTYIAGPGGTITGTATQEINKGASGTAVTATPNAGYTFEKWSDGKTTATRTDTNVQVSATYTATFKSTNVVPKTGIFDDTGNTIALGVVFLMMGLEWTWVSTLPMKAYNAISFTTSKIKEDRESKRVERRRNRLERRIK